MTHPTMPAGYNSWENNGDEVDGGGVNEAVWPVLFDTFESHPAVIFTEEMVAAFDDCPDFTVPAVRDTIVVPHENETLVVRGRR